MGGGWVHTCPAEEEGDHSLKKKKKNHPPPPQEVFSEVALAKALV